MFEWLLAALAKTIGGIGAAAATTAEVTAPTLMTNNAVDLWKVGGQAVMNNLGKTNASEEALPLTGTMDRSMFTPSTQTQDISKLFQDPQLASLLGGEDMNTLADLFSRMDKGSGLK